MAMAWPYGITDPNLYAYIMNAAASLSSYPYAMPNASSPLNYYASLGLQRAAAAYSPYGFPSPLRPLANPVGAGGLIRPTATTADPLAPPAGSVPPGLPCGLHAHREHGALSGGSPLVGGQGAPCTAGPGENCGCPPMFYSGLAGVTTSLPAPIPVSHSLSSTAPHAHTPSLFQPYKTDVERA